MHQDSSHTRLPSAARADYPAGKFRLKFHDRSHDLSLPDRRRSAGQGRPGSASQNTDRRGHLARQVATRDLAATREMTERKSALGVPITPLPNRITHLLSPDCAGGVQIAHYCSSQPDWGFTPQRR